MSYDIDAESLQTAISLLEEFGDGAVAALWRRAEMLATEGEPDDARVLQPVLAALMAIGSWRSPSVMDH